MVNFFRFVLFLVVEEENFFTNFFHLCFFHDGSVSGKVCEYLPGVKHKFFLLLSKVLNVKYFVIKVLGMSHSMRFFHFGYSHIVAYLLWGCFLFTGAGYFELRVSALAIFEFLDFDNFAADRCVVYFCLHKFIFAINLLLKR